MPLESKARPPLSGGLARGTDAINLVGFAHAHESAFQKVADQWDCVIMSRAPGWVCQQLIEEGYGSKGFHVKAKSCNWGPAAGFILEDIRLTKTDKLAFQHQEVQGRINYQPDLYRELNGLEDTETWRIPLSISDERVKFLENNQKELGIIDFNRSPDEHSIHITAARKSPSDLPEGNELARKYADIVSRSRRTDDGSELELKFVLMKNQELWGVYFDPGEEVCQKKSEKYSGLTPVMALTDPLNPISFPEHKRAITGDYDLFAIFPRDRLLTDGIGYEEDQLDLRIARIDEKSSFKEGHPDYGHVHQRIMILIYELNKAVYKQDVREAYKRSYGSNLSQETEADIEELVQEVWIHDELQPASRKRKDPLKESRHALPPIRKMVHHNDEGGRPQAPEIEYDLIGFVPYQKRAFGIQNLTQLKDFLKSLIILGFKIPINPSWRGDLESLGSDVFVPDKWANPWEDYKFGVQEAKAMSMPHSSENNIFSNLTKEPISLNGMKIIFDQTASVYPVSLQTKSIALQSWGTQAISKALEVEQEIVQNALYLPWPDAELTEFANNAIRGLPNMYPKILTGIHHLNSPNVASGTYKPLASLNPNVKLYLMTHGHDTIPIFYIPGKTTSYDGEAINNKGVFTPAELAKWIENDGLSKEHRDLELLVCSAALSVGSKATVKKRQEIQDKADKVRKEMREIEVETQEMQQKIQKMGKEVESLQIRRLEQEIKMRAQREAILKGELKQLGENFKEISTEPSEFRDSHQVIPLAAQFVQALKNRGYSKIRVTSYAGEVSANFGQHHPFDTDENSRGRGQVWVNVDGSRRYKPGKDHKQVWL
ncbi:hypothetical protein NDI52_31190 [Leptolyngbya sp. PL-A3]|uniref:anthrax toxin-like adenylyl cyclase domain-containing protein n=1 Tax=Leptolyngbya sp. PL-A3 TaxID=2933911 RepID=UPI0032968A75